MILGAHESVAGGLPTVFERAARDGCEAVQLWTRSSRQWAAKALDEPTVTAFKSAHRAAKKLPLAAHASYLINLAAASAAIWERSTETLHDECVRAEALGVAQLESVHPGAAVGCSTREGIVRVARALGDICRQLGSRPRVRLLLEITAGQGSCVGSTSPSSPKCSRAPASGGSACASIRSACGPPGSTGPRRAATRAPSRNSIAPSAYAISRRFT